VDGRGAGGVSERRVALTALAPGERVVEGEIGHYLARVLRVRAGDRFVAFDPATGEEADAVAIGVDSSGAALKIDVGALRAGAVRAPRAIVWIQALAKGDKCDAVVRDATELGATELVVAAARRSVVRLDDARAAQRVVRWTRIAREAARQSGRSDAPGVSAMRSWVEALDRAGAAHARFCLWEDAVEPLGPALLTALDRSAPLAFACGPEGGLEPDEVAAARDRGWNVVSLGARKLRTETVAAAVLGAVAVWSGLPRGAFLLL
jgi:16S rRNA (uracil1498-N3)-methyltransferase